MTRIRNASWRNHSYGWDAGSDPRALNLDPLEKSAEIIPPQIDIVLVGASCSGLSAALALARAGQVGSRAGQLAARLMVSEGYGSMQSRI